MAPRFLFHVGCAVFKQGVGGIAKALADPSPQSAIDLVLKIGVDVWAGLRAEKKQDRLNADILAAAKMDSAEIKRQAAEIALLLAPHDPVMQDHIVRLVTLVPASIVASLKRPDDPTGTTLPYRYAVENVSDIVRLLPMRFPREHFKAGYAPPFLNGWELVRPLGAGGFGEVWLARSSGMINLVGAVKISHPLNGAELSLLNEGDVLNRLLGAGPHPGIVAIQDNSLFRPPGQPVNVPHVPWIRYEYVPGGDLSGLIWKWATLPMGQRGQKVLAAFRELCQTVSHFHGLSPAIVHRDLKPSNILVTADGKLKVADFGIGSVSAQRVLDDERLGTVSRTNTMQVNIRGAHTPLYASPEQKRGDPPCPTDDVHALGVILFQMLTGKLNIAPVARFDRELPDVPQYVVDLIGDCVETDKANRPADAAAILAKLEPEPVARTPQVAVSRDVDPIELQVVPPEPIPVAIKPETAAQYVSRLARLDPAQLENEVQAKRAKGRAALHVVDFEIAKALDQTGVELTSEQRLRIDTATATLRAAMEGTDPDDLQRASDAFVAALPLKELAMAQRSAG